LSQILDQYFDAYKKYNAGVFMFLNNKIKYSMMLLSFLLAFADANAEETRQLNSLQDILVENKRDGLLIRLAFQKPLSKQKPPVFYKKSARIDFANAKFKTSSQYFPIKNSIIDQIYVSQFESDMLRMRFMLAKGDESLDKKFKWEVKGRFLNINILNEYKAPLESLAVIDALKNNPKKKHQNPKTSPKSVENIKKDGAVLLKGLKKPIIKKIPGQKIKSQNILSKPKENLLQNKTTPANQKISKPEKNVKRNAKPIFADTLNLRSTSLKMVYMMMVVLGILFSAFYLFKKYIWKNGGFAGQDKPVNVLSTGYLGPKKSIALVEVAGEVLVLGIANDNISLLSNIKDACKVERIKHPEAPTKLSSIVIKKKIQNTSENNSYEEKEFTENNFNGKSSEINKDNKYTKSDVAMMIRKNLEKMGAAT
jgi:flagellar biosynthetic protein FliO